MSPDRIRLSAIKDKFCRSISRPASRFLVRLGVTANQVTLFRLFILAPIMLFFMFQGGYLNLLIGVLIYELSMILDFVDGDIARINGPSRFGGIMDGRADSAMRYLVVVGTAVGLQSDMPTILGLPNVAVIIGFLTMLGFSIDWQFKVYLKGNYSKFDKINMTTRIFREIPLFLVGAIFGQLFLILVLVCLRTNIRWILIMLSIVANKEKQDRGSYS